MGSITLDGFVYQTTGLSHRPTLKKSRATRLGLTGKTLIRTFDLTTERYPVKILVPLIASGANGDVEDLKAAYDKSYVEFIDQLGNGPIEVVFEGELPLPYDLTLVDPDRPLVIDLMLNKRLV